VVSEFWQSNKSSGFFPVIDLAYSENKPGSKTDLSPWSSMKGNNSSSMQAPNSKDKSKVCLLSGILTSLYRDPLHDAFGTRWRM